MVTEINNLEAYDYFPDLSRQVLDLVQQARRALLEMDVQDAQNLAQDCTYLIESIRKAVSSCNDSLLVGITGKEDRYFLVACAQRCRRLKRVVHQVSLMMQGVQDLFGLLDGADMLRFESLFDLAEQELNDAVLSILREDEHLAFAVRKSDKKLDALYQEELAHIFQKSTQAQTNQFQVAAQMLFILRAIERIGDHAKHLAVPSFFHLAPAR